MIEIELVTQNFVSAVQFAKGKAGAIVNILAHSSKLLIPGDNEQRNRTPVALCRIITCIVTPEWRNTDNTVT
jgi:hypothetical protein